MSLGKRPSWRELDVNTGKGKPQHLRTLIRVAKERRPANSFGNGRFSHFPQSRSGRVQILSPRPSVRKALSDIVSCRRSVLYTNAPESRGDVLEPGSGADVRARASEMLWKVIDGTALAPGAAFFPALVNHLAEALGV